jgi:hypothetical protein
MPKATKLLAIAETPLVSLASETKEATTSEFLPCSPENEELIAPVMSLFFCDEDEDDNEEAEDATATAVATKDATPPIVTIAVPETPKIPAMPLLVTTSLAVIPEKKSDSAKPAAAAKKGKGLTETDEAKKVIKEDMSLGEGPFNKEIGGRRYRVHQSTGREMGAN